MSFPTSSNQFDFLCVQQRILLDSRCLELICNANVIPTVPNTPIPFNTPLTFKKVTTRFLRVEVALSFSMVDGSHKY